MGRLPLALICAIAVLLTSACTTVGAGPSPTPSSSPSGPTPSSRPASSSLPGPTSSARSGTSARAIPRPRHVVLVVEENRSYRQARTLPYFSRLARMGAELTAMRAEGHPSQPNYIALWSGSTQGTDSDACPQDFGSIPSLGSQLIAHGKSVAIYSEGLPAAGYTGCSSGRYVRKHNPLADFRSTSGASHNLPFTAFPTDFSKLPDVSVVVPNLDHDAHDGSLAQADTWLEAEMADYVRWAGTHDSLFLLTFDEDDGSDDNRILTLVVGQQVRVGVDPTPANHVSLLHTIESAFGLPHLGPTAAPISGIWK